MPKEYPTREDAMLRLFTALLLGFAMSPACNASPR